MTAQTSLQIVTLAGCALGAALTWLLFKFSKFFCFLFTCVLVLSATAAAILYTYTNVLGINGGDVVDRFVMSYMTGLAVVLVALALDSMLRAHEPVPARRRLRH